MRQLTIIEKSQRFAVYFNLAAVIFWVVVLLWATGLSFAGEPAPQAPAPKPSEYEIGVATGQIRLRMSQLETEFKQLQANLAELEALRDKKPEPTKAK